jgi:Single-strand binding protein family
MTAHVLVTGTIFRDPGQRSSKGGNAFVAVILKAKDGDAVQWWKVLAFSETAQAELMRLCDGEAVSVQCAFKVDIYTPPGREPRVSLTVFADHPTVLTEKRRRFAGAAKHRTKP